MPPRANLSREEPDAGIPLVRVCEGWGRQRPHLLGDDPYCDKIIRSRFVHASRTICSPSCLHPLLSELAARPPDSRDPMVYDRDWDENARMASWRQAVESTQDMPSLLAAAIALLAWEEIDPLQHKAWLGRLLVGAILRGRSRTLSHLLCVNTGLREIARDRRRARDSTTKLVALLDGFAEAAKWGMKEHDRWLLARRQLDRRLIGRRSNSSLPALADLVIARPILSAGLIARELKVTPRAAQDLVAELDLREMTGRGRYRAWGIL